MKNYKVTREQLKQIHSIACETWKKKIEKLTQDTLGSFNDEGELTREIVQSMRDAAGIHNGIDQKEIINNIFPKPESVNIKNYEDACISLERKPLTIKNFSFLPDKESKQAFARHKVITAIEAVNEGWIPDFDNINQRKFYSYGYKENGKIVLDVNDDWLAFSFVGSALLIENQEKAELIQKVFKSEIEEYLF